MENNTGKYLKYAIGEIFLVVFGILIALQINNWNEQVKGQRVANSYIKSLQADLENDVKALDNLIGGFEMELAKNLALAKRLSSPTANTDTIKKIARYEFLPYFNPTNELNLSTFNALIATGHIDLLQRDFAKKIQEHNAFQLFVLKGSEFNIKLAADVGKDYIQKYPLNSPQNAINGQIMDSFWDQTDDNQLKIELNAVLTSKIFVLEVVNEVRKELLKRTKKLILEIEDKSKDD
ncbi:MAG: DUF6090 family protein [Algoriphagus sp.]|jgi:hypothetical protein|uniref:DUF6090 family protein n=1 Tax=Algoriphagus sp. TaxID=1872435 RepID=UPI00260F5F4C|nr:DUF6090 family protein [Algoriphagus sp.]MDG1279102.1 DUF6090 family protein [Algoriphagus sp.]